MRYLFVIARPSEVIMFPGSSVVEQLTVNQLVAGSNPARGAKFLFEICCIKNHRKQIAVVFAFQSLAVCQRSNLNFNTTILRFAILSGV